jgi:hypothetical protein
MSNPRVERSGTLGPGGNSKGSPAGATPNLSKPALWSVTDMVSPFQRSGCEMRGLPKATALGLPMCPFQGQPEKMILVIYESPKVCQIPEVSIWATGPEAPDLSTSQLVVIEEENQSQTHNRS